MSSSSLVNLTVNVYFEAIVIKLKVCFEAIVALESSRAAKQQSSRAAEQQSSRAAEQQSSKAAEQQKYSY